MVAEATPIVLGGGELWCQTFSHNQKCTDANLATVRKFFFYHNILLRNRCRSSQLVIGCCLATPLVIPGVFRGFVVIRTTDTYPFKVTFGNYRIVHIWEYAKLPETKKCSSVSFDRIADSSCRILLFIN